MAKQQKKVESAVGPRVLAMYQTEDQVWYHVLTWVERNASGNTVAVHILRNDNGRVLHERKRLEEMQFLEATGVKTTAAQFEQYLREKLMENGGSPGAYEHLRVQKPVVEAMVSADKKEDHDELYARAARVLGVSEADLRKKYGHLNPGLQAMNLRNRLRAKGKAV